VADSTAGRFTAAVAVASTVAQLTVVQVDSTAEAAVMVAEATGKF
jgi:hypothetical protein